MCVLFTAAVPGARAAETTATPNPTLQIGKESSAPGAEADQLFDRGEKKQAAALYEKILTDNAGAFHARARLMRARLAEERVDEAYALGKAGLKLPGYGAELETAMGDVYFRRAEMSQAEQSYMNALKLDVRDYRARLGLAKLYKAYSLYGKAFSMLQTAHALAPHDREVRREWMAMLPRKQKLAALNEYLSAAYTLDADERTNLEEWRDFLQSTLDTPAHVCRMVSNVPSTKTHLSADYSPNRKTARVLLLNAKINNRTLHLELDTGASGLLLDRAEAEKAGVEKISDKHIYGIGDKGAAKGYTGVAKRIRIGELEFEDCLVHVIDKFRFDGDGLIGANVFANYLIDIDGPGKTLKLSPLPLRPKEKADIVTLQTESGAPTHDQKEWHPQDRYIAPEMQKWTKIFRFGHQLLIPTSVNNSPAMLFMIDTGASDNILASNAAKKVSKMRDGIGVTNEGINGKVKNVYSTDKASLKFGHLAQANEDILTLDLSSISHQTGTEVSGLLGFSTLKMLELKIDYRDGLVDFVYDWTRSELGQ